MPGAESGAGAWERYVTGTGPGTGRHFALADGFLKFVIFENPNYDFRAFNYDRDLPTALAKVSSMIDAMDPNLRPLQQRGGKFIVYHGWNDPSIPALNSVEYYESVVETTGAQGKTRDAALARRSRSTACSSCPGCSTAPAARAPTPSTC